MAGLKLEAAASGGAADSASQLLNGLNFFQLIFFFYLDFLQIKL